jgi:hypothetical protein
VVRRYVDRLNGGGLVSTDMLTIKIRYFRQAEEHLLELINGRPTDLKCEHPTGGTGTGEFGGVLRTIFDPPSQTAFGWESWKNVRKHRTAVFECAVLAAHSPYYLSSKKGQAAVGLHGILEIDIETGEVLRLTYIAPDTPNQLNLQSAVSTVDYDFYRRGGKELSAAVALRKGNTQPAAMGAA